MAGDAVDSRCVSLSAISWIERACPGAADIPGGQRTGGISGTCQSGTGEKGGRFEGGEGEDQAGTGGLRG